ncbi:hypothetical protein J2T38_000600 [Neisseria perflava]|nr:hypothetical protein [Neisseria perflava]
MLRHIIHIFQNGIALLDYAAVLDYNLLQGSDGMPFNFE